MENFKESDLYLPIKEYLVALGYDVKGEVKDCDVAATKEEELIVVELKRGFTIELLFQAIQRQSVADGVYVAVPLPKNGYKSARYQDMVRLCKRLEIGLILVGFAENNAHAPMIDVVVHPEPKCAVRMNSKKRFAIISEHSCRSGSNNVGGVTRRKILTVYKEHALYIAKLLAIHGGLTASELKGVGSCEKTSSILQKNFYKWYEKGDQHKYNITEIGKKALEEYADMLK